LAKKSKSYGAGNQPMQNDNLDKPLGEHGGLERFDPARRADL
jgi:hypothetical protein